MVSLRRRRLLGLCSGNNSLVTQLPLHRENLTQYENSSQNANNPQSKQSVVSDIASILDNEGTQNSQNTVVIDEPGSSNVSCSDPSKERLSQQHIENMKSLDSFNNLEVGKNVKARPVLERVAVSGSRSNAGSLAVPPPSPLAEPSCAVSLQTDGATVAGPHPLPPPSNTLKRGSEIVLSDPSHKQTKETVSNPSPTIQVAAQVCSSSGCLPSVWAGPPLILQHIGNMTSPIDKACLLDVSPVGIEKAFLENTVAIDESNVSCSSPSKEQPSRQNTGTTLSEQELPHPSDLNYSAPVQALKEDPMPLNKRRKLIKNMKSLDFDNNLEVGKNVKAQPVLERGAVSGSGSNAGSPAVPPPPSSPVESPCAVSSQTDGARVQLEIHQKISSEFIDRKREELNKVRQDVQETEALASSSSNQLFSRSSTPYGGKMFTSYVLWY